MAPQKINLARDIFVGKTLLGYPEEEVWEMTPFKLVTFYNEYKTEFKYRDAVYVALYQQFGLKERNPDDELGEDVE